MEQFSFRRRLAVVAAILVAGFLSSVSASAATSHGADWNGIWERATSGLNFDPDTPRDQRDNPPLTPEYAARYKANMDAMAAGKPTGDPTARCVPAGMPRMMNMVYLMEILMTAGQVTILAEWDQQVRRIYTDGRGHPPEDELDVSYNGHSVGRWEGDVLVVSTVGLREDTVLTQYGLEHSDQMTLTERFQLKGDILENQITIHDPKMLTKPWTVTKKYKRAPKGLEIQEYVCQENNRNPVDEHGVTRIILPPQSN